jgi:hypothetical protein
VHDALSHSDWRQAIELEMRALHQNETWELVPLPPHKMTMVANGSTWLSLIMMVPLND